MKKKILVTRRLLKENEEKLKSLFDVTLNKDDKIYSPQEIISRSKNYDGILTIVKCNWQTYQLRLRQQEQFDGVAFFKYLEI